jgi:hypothetical protein
MGLGLLREGEKFMHVKLPSKYGRCALSVDIIPPSTPSTTCPLVNVHLDSLGDTLRCDGREPKRLDKVATLGVEVKDIEILRPGLIEVPKPGEDYNYVPCSDQYGLRFSFTV